ncbi:lasso RiPP family leader peptide-containing protein [Georgenia sp. MJ173]
MYESPRITKVGSVPDLTLGIGELGNKDQYLKFLPFGPDPKDPPVGS